MNRDTRHAGQRPGLPTPNLRCLTGVVMSLLWAALVLGCDEPPPADTGPVDPCAGACTGDTACIDGMCVAPDAALAIDAATPMDAAGAPVDAGPECRAGQRQRCSEDGACGFAFQPCVDGEWGPCETPAERCDAVDNDCDGEVDEGFEVGAECSEGVGACQRPGTMVCGAEGGSVCNASPSEPEDEICNDLDDDCDGATDEGYADLATPCTVGVGACAQMGQTVCANDGGTKCSAIPAPPQAEACDGLDNDCDGTTDEWDPTLGLDCVTDQLGTCARGRHHCVDGALACLADLTPVEETCDGLDNDCDGTADEDGPPIGEACATENLGICALGTVACDDDGAWACSTVFEPIEETCHGRDDDCDGRVDEDGPQLAQVCDTGLPGECGTGIFACRHGALECDVLFEPTVEICNGLDEDCDGVADENTPAEPRPCRTGQPGDCDTGLIVCEDAAFVCRPAEPPQEERCDGRDNDCDTLADETFPGLGQSCGVGIGECRAEGIIGCSADDLESQCLAAPHAPERERCDGLDNDCNGVVDDLVEPPSEPDHCGACDVGCDYPNAHGRCVDSVCSMGHCRPGFVDLDGDIANGCEQTCLPSTPADEVCDGLDNDCDGVVDGPGCAGELFRFCRARAERGILDAVCHTFAPDEAESEFWPGSLIAAGDDHPSLFRRIEGEDLRDEGGGYTRRTGRSGPGFELGFHLAYQGTTLAIGLFITETPIAPVRDFVDPEEEEEEEEAAPDAGADAGDAGDAGVEDGPVDAFQPGQGYSIWIEPSDAAPEIIVRRSPEGDTLWRAQIPAWAEGERRFVRVRRAQDGAWRVDLDGRTIPADEVAALDTSTQTFDRLSVWLGPSQGRSTAIDSLSMRFDADGDGQYPPQDNCPHVYNPDQGDADQNGRGLACDDRDGDGLEDELDGCPLIPRTLEEAERDTNALCQTAYGLAFLARFSGELQPWVLNLSNGLYQAVSTPATAATGRLRASRDGWWTWTEDGTVFVQTPEGAVEARGAGHDPDFIGRRLVFLSEARRQVLTQERAVEAEPALLYEMEEDGTLSLMIGPLEQQLVLVQHSDDGIHLLELDLEGNPTMEPMPLSPDGDGQAPNVARHPSAQLFALAAVNGAARGIALLDGETGLTTNLTLSPTQSTAFTPDGTG